MIRLADNIRKNGFDYTLVQRNDVAAIYAQGNGFFEVFRIKQQKEKIAVMDGKSISYPEKELFPSNEDFGYTAWCCFGLHRALDRLLMINNNNDIQEGDTEFYHGASVADDDAQINNLIN